MPTGYTQMIIDEKVKTPKEFLHLCLRNFGICACMRDDEFKVEEDYTPRIMEFYQYDVDYHKKNLQSAEERLKQIQQSTDDELYQMYTAQYGKDKQYYEETIKKDTALNAKFDQFSEAIKNWECSPEYNNIKAFALDQLKISKESVDYWEEELAKMGDLSREDFEQKKDEYKEKLIECANWDIDYHTKEMKSAESKMAEAVSFYHFFKQELEKLK